MTSDRSYRNPLSPYEALKQLEEMAPDQFDPRILDALKKTVAETTEAITDAA
jgi:HD-GYP domain-containing protein (c-di-GMP phosphodiesterase class II)